MFNLWLKNESNNYTKTKLRYSSTHHYWRCRVIEPVIDTLRNHRKAIILKPDAAASRVRESRAGHLERRSDTQHHSTMRVRAGPSSHIISDHLEHCIICM